jgi:hypothetical protein
MDDREKLSELLKSTPDVWMSDKSSEMLADHLIANGVTVQQWIPASEPPKDDLPVLVTCGKGYRPFVARYDLVWNRWKVSHTLKITHWQPLPSTRDLPQPPKEG